MNATHMRKPTLMKRKRRSVRSIWEKQAWWFTQMIPIVRNETAYAAYCGHECASAWPSLPPSASTDTSMISRVAAIAKTPSANVSSRPVDTRRTLRDVAGGVESRRDRHGLARQPAGQRDQ